ncbi:MAG TPA: DUF3352 domain-containing protein [Solirubrobacteraceae bacterium]|nr:DUF3352 domain-containing protein [Solirubrobacteraceae bacterium]
MPDRRLKVVLALSAVIVAAAVAVALVLGSGDQPPATGAARLVPADALIYVHLSTDVHRPAVKRAISLARRFPDFPLLSGAIQSQLSALLGGPAAPARRWLGQEAAFALLNTDTATAGSLVVLDVARPRLARQLVAGSGAAADGSYRGTALLRYPSGTELAFVSHYLVAGQAASVRTSIDVAAGRQGSLARSPAYQQAAGDEPSDRVLDAYLSVSGVHRVLTPRSGLLGALGALLEQPALTGVAMSLSAVPPGARVIVRGSLDPTLAKLSGPTPTPFEPTLPGAMPAQGALLLDVSNLVRWAPRVLGATAKVGVAGRVQPLFRRLGSALAAQGVDVHALTGVFSGEAAVAISPSPASAAARAPARRRPLRAHGPALVIVTRTRDEEATSSLLASLQGPLAQLFPPPALGPGQAPEFSDVPVDGITVHRFVLAPGLELDYAVFRGLVVLATSLPAITGIVHSTRALDSELLYQAALGRRPDQVTSLLFLDFSQLLRLGEQTGLVHGRRATALLPDLERIRSIGLASTRGEADTNAELFLQIP